MNAFAKTIKRYRVLLGRGALAYAFFLAAGEAHAAPTSSEPSPAIGLSLDITSPNEWAVRFDNRSAVPYRIANDLRFLSLEVRSPGDAKPSVCRLPRDLAPNRATSKTWTTLEPGDTLSRRFDPRFYCFRSPSRRLLRAGVAVTARFGEGTRAVIARPTPNEPGARLTHLFAEPVTLPVSDVPTFVERREPASATQTAPVLEMVRGSDAPNERAVTASVRIRNPTGARVVAYVRRELLSFEVVSRRGTVTCSADDDRRNPTRGAYTTLPPHGSKTLVSRLVEVCPRGTFAGKGLYFVGADYDTGEDGADVGLHALTLDLHSKRRVPVRVRHSIRLFPSHHVKHPAVAAKAKPAPPPKRARPRARRRGAK